MPFEEGPYTGKIHSDSDNTGAAVEGLGSGAASAAEALYNVPAYVWNQSRGAGPAAQFVPQLPYSHVGDDMFREALQKADPSIHGLVQMENLLKINALIIEDFRKKGGTHLYFIRCERPAKRSKTDSWQTRERN